MLNRCVLRPELASFDSKDLLVTAFGPSDEHTLTLSITALLDILTHNVTFIRKTLVESESVSHVFFLPPSLSQLSTSNFQFCKVHTMRTHFFAPLADFMYPLCHPPSSFLPFRLVHSGPGKSSPLLDSDLSFGLRSGTKQGVETHVFRVDSAKELSTWTHLLVEGCHNAAELIKEVTTGAKTEICLSPRQFCLGAYCTSVHLKVENSTLNLVCLGS